MQHATLATPHDTTYLAVAGFLARYSNEGTRKLYELDLRIFTDWCRAKGLRPLVDVQRVHVELFGRHLEVERGNGPSSVAHRLGVIQNFYAVCEEDGIIDKSPATRIRLPKVWQDESKTLGLDRLELGAFLAAARVHPDPTRWALATLMGMLGLRVSEACAVQIEDYAHEQQGHRVLRLVGKGGKPATLPLPVPVLRALDAAAAGRTRGPLLRRADGEQLDRRTADRWVKALAKRAGIEKRISPHSLRHSMITNALDAGVPLRDVQIAARHSDPRTTTRYDRNRGNLDRHAVHTLAAYVAGGA
ncbi:tyrosine-type recombinase/integrase [Nocardioides campestrisoli]|uniref:tyrosine-type recombinase/integrase n=1 Tax=Nocardioides campestrisoli TaxID=2736757 RepID=UPI0015E65CA6|nr:tyrosine-type recombinase/integrase [Nocardioides campestrisoli]